MARKIRRGTLLLGVVMIIWAWLSWGARWVPSGMDTVPTIPPGSLCVLDKWSSTVQTGSHVFIELPGHGVVLSRVAARAGDRITIEHPNANSRYPDSRSLGELPISAVVGTVLGAFGSVPE